MTFNLNSRFIVLLGISLLIHALVFFLNFSKAPSSSTINNSLLTVSLMQLPQRSVNKTLSATANVNVNDLESDIKEPIANEEVEESAADLEQPPSEVIPSAVKPNDDLTTLSLAVPEPIYYGFNELDQIPTVIENIEGDPAELVDYPQGGTLKIQLWVDEFGSVLNAEVVESDLPVEFSKVAAQAFLKVKFSPGLKNNVPVRSVTKIVVHYAALVNPA